ncbi:MAG: hypothetical protein E7122_08330 [Bacteroidales bacterium]|nr:hypothetical protein [Bacteroidales bacterium]
MKRFLLIIAMVLAYLPAFSQINLKDSTVQVVAYWQKGEKYFYDTKSYELLIENGDTSTLYEINGRFSIEVIDSTANSYKLKYKQENMPDLKSLSEGKDTVTQMVFNVMEKYMDRINIPVVFITDEYGTFQDVEGIDALQKEMYSIVASMVKDFEMEFNSKFLGDITEEEKKQTMAVIEELYNGFILEQYKDRQGIYKNFKEIINLLTFHGTKLNLNKEYISSSKEVLPIYGDSEIDIKETFYVYEYNPETSWIYIDYFKKYNPEQLNELAFNMAQQIASNVEKKAGKLPEGSEIKKEDIPEFTIDCYTGVQVHTNTGWPGNVYSEKRTKKGKSINLG